MARQYKKVHRAYTAWNYQKEIEDLNKASEQGWQLIKGGSFSSKFKWNPDIRYRYQLDYPGTVEDKGRYIETFREQGWEYVNSTFNGWHYFRKPYHPALPEEQYEIFTDRASLKEMNGRWAKLALILSCIMGLAAAVELVYYFLSPKLPTLIQVATLGFTLAVFIRGILIMRNPEKRKSVRWDGLLFAALILVLIVGNASAMVLMDNRPWFNSVFAGDEVNAIPAEMSSALEWNTIDIAYSDNYYVDLDITSDSPVCCSIRNEAGEVIYTMAGSSVAEENVKLNLKAGTYTVVLSDFAGGSLNVSLDID